MSPVAEPVVVVGGGIAGLAAAWQLKRDGMAVHLYECADQVGGKVRSSEFAGQVVDEAADAFLARVPHGIELATELGLADRLISPSARKAQVWTDNGLMALPEPHVLGIPLERASVEALLGVEAADALEADLARTEPDPVRQDDTIGSLVRRRLGDRIHEALVDPLIGAINAGATDDLALSASSPQILAAANAGPSLIGALRRMKAGSDPEAPVFHSFVGGMRVLVDALEASLEGCITTGVGVDALDHLADGALRVCLSNGEVVIAPAVVLACPAPAAAELTSDWPNASADLAAIPLVSVTLVALAYPAGTVPVSRELSGFVVPRNADLKITACSYAMQKWPHLGGSIDLLRVSVGHGRDQQTPALPDDELLAVILADLETAIGITAEPSDVRISRWQQAFPQYVVGHNERLGHIEGQLNPDGVFIAGMGYRGIGIPACIDQGRSAGVDAILHVLEHR
jgi:oxygen-dependent protoporphyrinogen oxidase